MENRTHVTFFHILPFLSNSENKQHFSTIFFLIYLFGLLANCSIITVICADQNLHIPLYLFLCNLSFVDIFYTTVTVPKILDILLTGNDKVSFIQCFTQMFCLIFAAGTENMLLAAMAYDRYVAICDPLHYHHILCWKNCILLMLWILVMSCLNSFVFTYSASYMSFCHSNVIQQFFCDAKALTKISCAGSEVFYTVFGIEASIFGLGPFLCSLMSYIKIIKIILNIKSKDGKKKAFSTCSSHVIVILMYYGAAVSVYTLPSSNNLDILEQIFTVLYTTIAPMLNPIIYSLRNTDVKIAIKRLVGAEKCKIISNTM